MALTRKALKAMGLTEEQVDSVIEMHTETVDGLKAQISEQKEAATQLEEITKERDELKAKIADEGEADKKYKALQDEFDSYKKGVEAKQESERREAAYKELLKSAGIGEKYIPAILKVTDLSKEKLDKDGKLENADALKESAVKGWAEFIPKDGKAGASTETPPDNNGGKNGSTGRAAELAAQYHAMRYGETKETGD